MKVPSKRTRPFSLMSISLTAGSNVLACGSIMTCARAIRDCRYMHMVYSAQPVRSRSAASSVFRISGVALDKLAVAAQTDCIPSERNAFFPHHFMQAK